MATHTPTTNFRALFTISDILQEVKITNSVLKIQLCGVTKYVQLPCTKPVPLDFPGAQMGTKIEFDLEDADGNIYGYSELSIPETAFKNRETQINQHINFYLNNSDKEFVASKVFIILLNTEVMQRPKFKNALPKTPSKSTNTPAKSPSKSFSTPQKMRESGSHKRQRTEDRGSQQEIRDFDDSVRENNDTFDQGDLSKIHNAPQSQASLDSFLPSSLAQLSTPKNTSSGHDEQSTFTSKIDQGSASNISDKGNPKKTQVSPQAKLEQRRHSEAIPDASRDKRNGQRDRLISLIPLDNNTNSSFNVEKSISAVRKEDQDFHQTEGDTIDVFNSYVIPTESDHNPFQTFCPGSGNRRSPNRLYGSINSPEKRQDRSPDDDGRVSSSSKKRRPPVYSPISEKNVTSRLSYSENAYYKTQVEQLQNALLMKDTEITIVSILKKENADLRAALLKSEEARKSLQLVSSETAIELKQANQDLQSQVTRVLQEKKDFLNKNIALQNRVEELEKTVNKTKSNLTSVENNNAQLSIEVKELRNANGNMITIQQTLENFEQKRNEERVSYMNSLTLCQKGLDEAMARIQRLTREKKEISEEFQKAQLALIQEKNNSQALQDELFMVHKNFQNAESYKLLVNSLESEKQELIKILFDKKKGQAELQTLLDNIKAELAERIKEGEKKEEQHISQTNTLKSGIKQYEEKIGSLTNEITELKLRVSELITEESALGQLVCLNKDVEQQLEVTNQKLAQVTSEKEKLTEQLLGLCQNQEMASARLLQSEKANLEIKECLNEKDEYIASLKKMITELRETQTRYLPHKDDPIDAALARYLNSKHDIEKLKFLFFREGSGVYQFGTKRVYIKLEGDQIIIRVGGGYSTIEEFLEQHSQSELEKLLKNGSISASGRNIIVSKSSAGRSSHSIERSKVQGY